MPPICKYHCDHCDFSLPGGWGGYMYVEDDSGKRVPCSHPGEEEDVIRVLSRHFGESFKADFPSFWAFRRAGVPEKYLAEQKLIYERVGYNSECVCTSCLHQFEADLAGGRNPWRRFYAVARKPDARICPKCGSGAVQTVLESVGKPCPKCKTGTIKEEPTGWWT